MNKTKIEWCDYTWNPVTGCRHGCPYCYAERISKRFTGNFEPTFHASRLDELAKLKKPSKIFVVSMGDLFGDWAPSEWIEKVFTACEKSPQHTYIFLTKNPARYTREDSIFHAGNSKRNWWYGTTITTQCDYNEKAGKLPLYRNGFLSIEPIVAPIELIKIHQMPIKWAIVGAQTGPGAVPPKREWVQSIVDQCRAAKVPVFLKNNLNWPEKIQEVPNA